ncbi:M1 family metallopeptidase [Maribacter hydrothermalis]|uniref:Aminopeptidase N n=1 Tax=Maribacter hydrothermalis TaxID=1836467 RepID=A0A1B7Z1I9_9FLAO|nr:M1 family aminopeptidase [Maribacter hydrothermalis]APQ18246.1 peptidase M1 [Maribacter hydrothermalis]OBR36592.1 peptidase M1 [Maribacter hydrothermalis]
MKNLFYASFLVVLLISCSNDNEVAKQVESGVSEAMATQRASLISKVHYNLSFDIPKQQEDPISSKLILDFDLKQLQEPVYLDFKEETSKIKSVSINETDVAILHKNEHIILPKEYLIKGNNTITIEFYAGELSLNRNEDYLYTLLVPDRARTLFPCFDQPNIKGIYTLNISAPNDWKVLCGSKEIKQTQQGEYTRHEFGASDQMSTYLFSFVTGKFESVTQKPATMDMTMLYRETDSTKIKYSLDSIFNLHQQSLSFLEAYTAYLFPFQKMDFASIPGFQYGGMEHVGAIQYRENSLFLDESATANNKLSRAKLIAHETSHMWFGDLVTMNWFNDVWMKEMFANFMADKIMNPAFPDIDHQLAFMITHYPNAYSEDRTLGTNPIRQDLENLNNAGSLYGSIIYNKAPIMMRQLETVLGKEAFQKGIQEYIKTFAFKNAVWGELITILDKKSSIDMVAWSDVWVNNSSRPIFSDSIEYDGDNKIASFKLSQKAEDISDHSWPQTFEVLFLYPDETKTLTVNMIANELILDEAIGLSKPTSILYNSNAEGYGVFPLKEKDLEIIPKINDQVARGYAYINVYENMLNGSITPTAAIKLYSKGLVNEKNELLINLISRYSTSVFWKYLTAEQRLFYQKEISEQVWSKLQEELPANIKKTLYATYTSIGYTDVSLKHLYEIWNKKLVIKDLKLNDDNYTELAMDLALYGHPESKNILKRAEQTISNNDKLNRLKFLLPSLSKDQQTRNDFFESLKQEENRAKESWVANAMNNLNHPLLQKESIQYLRASLDLLDEIQKTGDIFFPKRWLSSTIGNYSSPEAYEILQSYLEENPNLNSSLKLKVLQASDDLRRVQLLHKPIDSSLD